MELIRPVFVIGFMGAGKTTLTRKLARNAAVAAVDADTYLERSLGRSIADVFATDGEAAFRRWEAETLKNLAAGDPMLISCGGGVVTTPEARAVLSEDGYVVYLQVDFDEAAERIGDGATRPLFQDQEAARALWESRAPLYESVADLTVTTAGKGLNRLADEVAEALTAAGVLVPDNKVTPGQGAGETSAADPAEQKG